MNATILRRTLVDRRRATLLFAVAAIAVASMYISLFPSMQDQMAGYADALPEALRSFIGSEFGDAAGYLHSTIFTILGPVLLVSAAVVWGAGAIAGEEESGTLALLLSVPVSRRRVAGEKAVAILLALTVLAAVVLATLLAWVAGLGIDVAASGVAAATLHLHALAVFAAGLALGVGAALGRKAAAIGTAAGVVVAGFVMSGVGGMIEGGAWLENVSPFYWFNGTQPIENGVAAGGLLLLYGLGALAAVVGTWRFDRRDLT